MQNEQKKQKRTGKQTAALVCVVLIAIMILATLFTAIFDSTGVWFRSCLILMITVPILSWVYIWLYGLITRKHSIASVDLLQTDVTGFAATDDIVPPQADAPTDASEGSADK